MVLSTYVVTFPLLALPNLDFMVIVITILPLKHKNFIYDLPVNSHLFVHIFVNFNENYLFLSKLGFSCLGHMTTFLIECMSMEYYYYDHVIKGLPPLFCYSGITYIHGQVWRLNDIMKSIGKDHK